MKRILLSLLLSSIALAGCSSSGKQSVAGKYSRTSTYFTPEGKAKGRYKNTTELKADGTYNHSTDREGYKVLETGTYEVGENTITFHAKTGRSAREVYTDTFDGKAINPDKFFKRVKE